MSDTIRCATGGHKAYRAGDTAQLAKYIDHLQQNYMDYIQMYEPGDYVVDHVVNWLEIALNNLNDKTNLTREDVEELYRIWFGERAGENKCRSLRYVGLILTLIDRAAMRRDTEDIYTLQQLADNLRFKYIYQKTPDLPCPA